MAPTHLLMDLAGVLAGFDRAPRVAALAQLAGLSEDEVHRRLYGSGFVDSADAGEVDADGVRAGIRSRLDLHCPLADLEAAWMAAFAEDDAALAVLDAVRPPAVVALLTNNDALVGTLLAEHLPGVAERCDAVLVAGFMKVTKPDERAYTQAAQALDVPLSSCLFVDDKQENVDGGLAAGLDSVLYAGPDQLRAELTARGLLGS
ncbi:HAD-IA family hydrolase [Rhodococcus sp. X156]|uniref:HAD-IA family hydrolase n=1 Tax=Rhodococcus sp. X156 TaxID=2499145 RepID=UPI000FD8C86B|nr:HAD-IA family hydrolase [Rhodococcus sp. X156]